MARPPLTLAHAIAVFAALKILILSLRPPAPKHVEHHAESRLPVVLLAFMILLVLFVLWDRVSHYPVYTWMPSDSWNYLQVQVQFSANPGRMNIQPGITAQSVNYRLVWSSWLYNRAMMTDLAQADPVSVHQRDGLYVLSAVAIIMWIALGRELLPDCQGAWLAAFLQLGFVLSGPGSFFTERVIEDKFFSFFVFFPLVYMLLLRYLRQPGWACLAQLVFLCIGLSLIHPVNPVILCVTALPFMFFHWLILRCRDTVRRTLPAAAIILLLLIYPLLVQAAIIRQSPPSQRSGSVSEAVEQSRRVPLDYSTPFAWGHTFHQLDYLSLYALLLTFGFYFAVRRREDIAAHFVFALCAAVVLLIWVPPFAALGVFVLTRSQNWRIFMLLPAGYAAAYLLSRAWEHIRFLIGGHGLFRRLEPVWAPLVAVALAFAWSWPQRIPVKIVDDSLTADEQAAFAQNRAVVGAGRVLATRRLSRAVPTLWPDALVLFSGRATALAEDELALLVNALQLGEDTAPDSVLRDYRVDYLLLSPSVPLVSAIDTYWPCCVLVYQNPDVVLYRVRADPPPYVGPPQTNG